MGSAAQPDACAVAWCDACARVSRHGLVGARESYREWMTLILVAAGAAAVILIAAGVFVLVSRRRRVPVTPEEKLAAARRAAQALRRKPRSGPTNLFTGTADALPPQEPGGTDSGY